MAVAPVMAPAKMAMPNEQPPWMVVMVTLPPATNAVNSSIIHLFVVFIINDAGESGNLSPR